MKGLRKHDPHSAANYVQMSMFLDCERKLEYMEKTYKITGRTSCEISSINFRLYLDKTKAGTTETQSLKFFNILYLDFLMVLFQLVLVHKVVSIKTWMSKIEVENLSGLRLPQHNRID